MAVTTFLVFVIPIIVITVLYVLMGITLYKTSDRTLSNNQRHQPEHIIINHQGKQHVFLRQNTASVNKSRPVKNSRRAVLKMLGKQMTIISNLSLEIIDFSCCCHCIFYLLCSISYSTYNCICNTFIR